MAQAEQLRGNTAEANRLQAFGEKFQRLSQN